MAGAGTGFATELDTCPCGGTAVDPQGNIDLDNGLAYPANDPNTLVNSLQAAINTNLERPAMIETIVIEIQMKIFSLLVRPWRLDLV